MGVSKDRFNIEYVDKGVYFLKMLVYDKNIRMHWNLITVYGDAQLEGKACFLAELARLYHDNPLPCLVGEISILLGMKRKKKINLSIMSNGLLCLMLSLNKLD